jgi:SAM-dependent methyltransferase
MVNFWDERYSASEYIYGKSPNEYFKSVIDELNLGFLLLPGEGEGRNAVYAASKGWNVTAFDSSEIAKSKTIKLCEEKNVKINYLITDAQNFNTEIKFDVIAFIFTHFGKVKDNNVYNRLLNFLKPEATVIFECFSKNQIQNQINYNSGGPNDVDMLFSIEDLLDIFRNFDIKYLKESNKILNEGSYHKGKSSIISFHGIKKYT